MEEQNPIQRLHRHLLGAGAAHADRRTASERLSEELGPELFAVVLRCLGAEARTQRRDVA